MSYSLLHNLPSPVLPKRVLFHTPHFSESLWVSVQTGFLQPLSRWHSGLKSSVLQVVLCLCESRRRVSSDVIPRAERWRWGLDGVKTTARLQGLFSGFFRRRGIKRRMKEARGDNCPRLWLIVVFRRRRRNAETYILTQTWLSFIQIRTTTFSWNICVHLGNVLCPSAFRCFIGFDLDISGIIENIIFKDFSLIFWSRFMIEISFLS